jgi:hypothetical protein
MISKPFIIGEIDPAASIQKNLKPARDMMMMMMSLQNNSSISGVHRSHASPVHSNPPHPLICA